MNFYKNLFKDYVKSFFFDSTEKKNDYDFAYSNKQIKFASSQLWKLELLYLFKIIKIKKPSLGLDFGCNEGTGTEKISTITNSKMFGVDSSEIAIEKAKKKKN